MHEALLRGAHRYTHVPCFSAYTSLPSIVAPRPRWICRSVPPSLFLLFFLFQTFAASKSAVRFFPCFRDNSNFFLKNLIVFCHLRYNCVDGGKRKRESYPIFREKFVEKFQAKSLENCLHFRLEWKIFDGPRMFERGILIRIILKIVLRAEEFGNIVVLIILKSDSQEYNYMVESCNSILLLANTLDSQVRRKNNNVKMQKTTYTIFTH